MFSRFSLECRMRSPFFRCAVNLILIVIIFIAAAIGGALGIKGIPLEFSLVWPATGFSLAAVLLFGFRVLPGIFLGNLFYNFLNLYAYDPSILSASVAAGSFVSLGSTFQAFLGGYIIRRYCFPEYFSTLKDVLIFLIPVGLLTCIVASTIGNFTLWLYGGLMEKDVFYTWITFSIGDLMGIYIFTPLLVVWTTHQYYKEYIFHALLISVIFIIVSYLTFGFGYQLTHFYSPLCIWAAYCFSMHGATLSVFITSLLTLTLTSAGLGPFVAIPNAVDPLFFLVSFLVVNIATSLIFAAVQEEKQASIGKMTFGVMKQILSFLNEIRKTVKRSSAFTAQLKKGLQSEKIALVLTPKIAAPLIEEADSLEKAMASLLTSNENVNRMAKLIRELYVHSYEEGEIRIVNLHTLLNNCVDQAVERMKSKDDHFLFSVDRNFHKIVTNVTALPRELAYAFDQFINHSLFSLKKKRKLLGGVYEPKLEINTHVTDDGFKILFKDNGQGVPCQKLQSFFVPFKENDFMVGEEEGYGLSLAFYIIVNIHNGTIQVESEEGNFLEVTVTLPWSGIKR